jgi:hypothetical protein
MSLDTERIHRLKSKSFDMLHSTHAQKWKEMVTNAKTYAQTCVTDGDKARIGDVVIVVQNAIRIDPAFEQHMKSRGLTQKYWVAWFAEYIVEAVYPQPNL